MWRGMTHQCHCNAAGGTDETASGHLALDIPKGQTPKRGNAAQVPLRDTWHEPSNGTSLCNPHQFAQAALHNDTTGDITAKIQDLPLQCAAASVVLGSKEVFPCPLGIPGSWQDQQQQVIDLVREEVCKVSKH